MKSENPICGKFHSRTLAGFFCKHVDVEKQQKDDELDSLC